MASQVSPVRFPLAFAMAATCGVGAGLMDRGLPFFEHRPAVMWAALAILCGGVFGTIMGAEKRYRLPTFFVFLFMSGGIAALTSGYSLVAGPPSLFEVAVLISIIGLPASLFFKSIHIKTKMLEAATERTWAGIFLYLGATLGLSWATLFFVPEMSQDPNLPAPLRLLLASATYAAFMGWQPLVAVYVARWWERPQQEDWFALPRPNYFLLAALAPLCISGIAIAVAHFFGISDEFSTMNTRDAAQPWTNLNVTVAAICGGLCLLWIQALTEEVGWRGYFLDQLMRCLGPLVGLVVHGVLWGVWYAPLLMVANGALSSSGSSYITFLVTCMLLGCLLGWLRLASHSVLSSALANGTLTVCAGLPFLLAGQDPGIQASAYGPPGWLPMGAALIFILATKHRLSVFGRLTSTPILVVLHTGDQEEESRSSKVDRALH